MGGLPVVVVASGGLAVFDTGGGGPLGLAVTEVAKYGLAITKVAAGKGMGVVFVTDAGSIIPPVPPIVYTTLNPASVVNTTLSNGNLKATHSNTADNSGARTASVKSTGKYYFEVTIGATHGGLDNIGIAIASVTHTNMTAGGVNGVVLFMSLSGGVVYTNGSSGLIYLDTTTAGDIVGVAVDLVNRHIWFRKNAGGNWNNLPIGSQNPATNTGGTFIPAGSMAPILTFGGSGTALGDFFVANFGASAFAGSVPAGFTSGWPT